MRNKKEEKIEQALNFYKEIYLEENKMKNQTIPDWAKEETTISQGGGSNDYEPCLCKIINMDYYKDAEPTHSNPLIRDYGNVIEIKLGVKDGRYKGKTFTVAGTAKTRKGEWACYPAYNEKGRPILRELLERIREYENNPLEDDERFEKFAPKELFNKELIYEIKEITNGSENWLLPLTDYQKNEDNKFKASKTGTPRESKELIDAFEAEEKKEKKLPWEEEEDDPTVNF